MYSKNNKYMQEQKSANRAQRFSLRKLSIGTVSVLLGTLMFFSNGQVSADTTTGTDTSADTASVNSAANDTSASAVTLSSTDSSAASAQTATAAAASTSATDSSQAASTASSTASSASAATTGSSTAASTATDASTWVMHLRLFQRWASTATDASTATTANSQAASDDAASAEGKITYEGRVKGLTDSDVSPVMSNANGASVVADESNIPSGYKADPTDGRYTFGIISLGGDYDKWGIDNSKYKSYNGENNTNYYIRFSTSKNATNGIYDNTAYVQVVDATTDTVKWERALTPNSGAVKINNGTDGFELSSVVAGVTQYYEITYTNTKIDNVSTSRISINPNNGSLTSLTVYSNGKAATNPTPGTYTGVTYPATGTIKTEYIAKDAAGNETTLATYEETGREGYKYTASDSREFKGYDLISTPSSTTGNLAKTYHVGDVYVSGNLVLSDQLQLARVYVVTSDNGYARVELRVALQKDADGNAITINSVNDSSIWKTILSTDSLAPGAFASNGNYGSGTSYYINSTDGKKYITDAGFTEEQLAGYNKHLTVIVLALSLIHI